MAIIAQTFTIATADALYTINLSTPTQLLNMSNLDTVNGVWINFQTNTAVVAEADETIFIRPSETIIIRRVPTFRALAVTGAIKLNVWGTDNI